MTLYKVVIRPVLLNACESWSATRVDGEKVPILERKIFRKISGPKKNNIAQQYEIKNNME